MLNKILFSFFFFLFSSLAMPVLAAENVVFDDGGVSSKPVAATAKATSTAAVENHFPVNDDVGASVDLDAATAAKGYYLKTKDNNFVVTFSSSSLLGATKINVLPVADSLTAPWKLERISPIYQFDLSNSSAYDNKKPITLAIGYSGGEKYYKRIYFFDKNFQSWRELPTIDDPGKKIATAKISLPYAQVAVFSEPAVLVVGKSSWYAYKNGNFAASVDFPKGSKLRVYNTSNNKSVDITINDFGPERDKFPDRILDLDKLAFKKIAKKGEGVINVRIQPLYVAPDTTGRVLGVSEKGAMAQPDIKAPAAIVTDEKTGAVIWEKNPDTVMPLASLSKLIAVKVFFDQRPTLNKVVTYKKQDELYNYQYCTPAESARLKVNDGDTMTVSDLVYSALVGSANNAVESLVRVSGLSRDTFIAKMNEYAASVGATSTRFVEPTGLSPQNVSTVREYAIITREIFKAPLIQKITVTPKFAFSTINTKKRHVLSNTNNFIRDGVFAAANNLKVTGSKTGYLDQYNLMTRVAGPKKQEVIAVDFGATTKLQNISEIQELLQYGIRKIQ